MIGLTDRIEPWVRRFQRAHAAPRRSAPAAALRARPAGTPGAGTPDAGAAAGARGRRFLRRALQER